jgi:cellulose synthase/poly-beta-1,6-N-acetylglucosamine synthase-like glycosyltransferase
LRLAIERDTDWLDRAHRLIGNTGPVQPASRNGWRMRLSDWFYRRQLDDLRSYGGPSLSFEQIYHLVVIPVAKESRSVIEPGVESLSQQSFPSSRIVLLLALEARAPEAIKQDARAVAARYREHFLDLRVIEHPAGLPGEAQVKGANTTYAAQAAVDIFKERGIARTQVIASCFDADTVVSSQYMACLTYHYLVCPDRTQASFQPIPVYHNNIWEAPGIARVLDIGASFFQLVEATNPETLVTFSSHSMSFQALVEVGFWPKDMISDDSAIYWKAFIYYDGRYKVIPMYVTVSMDVVAADSWLKTVRSVYRQKRRWAWGVENVPIVMRAFFRAHAIPAYDRLRLGVKLIGGHVAWSTWAFLLTIIGWLPAIFAEREFSDTVLYYSTPRITGLIFNLASLALVTTVVLSLCLLPKEEKASQPLLKRIILALEWVLVPAVAVFLSALPALDAQTRLMLGRYMEFWVTDKRRTS